MQGLAVLKKELREKIHESSIFTDVFVSSDAKQLTFKRTYKAHQGYKKKEKHCKVVIEAEESFGTILLRVKEEKKGFGYMEDAYTEALAFYEKYAKLSHVQLIWVDGSEISDRMALSMGLKLKDNREWSKYTCDFSYFAELTPGEMDKRYQTLENIHQSLHEIKKQQPDFDYTFSRKLAFSEYISYYYQGQKGQIAFSLDAKGQLNLEHAGEKQVVVESDIKNKVTQILEEIYHTKRVENLFHPPREIFNAYCTGRPKEARDVIFEKLSQCYAPNEIDKKVALQREENAHFKVFKTELPNRKIIEFF